MRSAETELQNTIELRATASEIVAPKPDGSRRQSEKKTILKHFLKGFLEGKSLAPKWRKSADKSLWQPSCSHSNTIYEVQLQKTIVLRMQPQHEATLTQPFTLRERSYSCKSQWNSIGNSSTSNTCNPIYIAGTILQLQQWNSVDRTCTENTWNPIYNAEPIREWSDHDPTTHETVSHPSHRRGRSSRFGDALCMEKHRVSCICYLSKTHFVRDFLQNSIGNSSTSTTCNPIYSEGTILELQITMEFHRQLIHQHHLQSHLHCGNDPTVATMEFYRPHMHGKHLKPHLQCGTDPRMIREYPTMIRPHTRPSRTRRTAEVDHRGSGTNFVWKNTRFRASAISQKRISCETSFKTPSQLLHQHHLQSHLQWGNDPRVANHNGIPSATHPPAPLATPFTMRERSYSCKSQWNSVDHTCTKNSWNPIYNAEPIREWSENIRPWSDHTRDRLAPVAPQR